MPRFTPKTSPQQLSGSSIIEVSDSQEALYNHIGDVERAVLARARSTFTLFRFAALPSNLASTNVAPLRQHYPSLNPEDYDTPIHKFIP